MQLTKPIAKLNEEPNEEPEGKLVKLDEKITEI